MIFEIYILTSFVLAEVQNTQIIKWKMEKIVH